MTNTFTKFDRAKIDVDAIVSAGEVSIATPSGQCNRQNQLTLQSGAGKIQLLFGNHKTARADKWLTKDKTNGGNG
jgi:hypothetical protein